MEASLKKNLVQQEYSASGRKAPEEDGPGIRVQRSQLRLAPPNGIHSSSIITMTIEASTNLGMRVNLPSGKKLCYFSQHENFQVNICIGNHMLLYNCMRKWQVIARGEAGSQVQFSHF